MLVLVGNPEDRFSYNVTHIKMITAILWVYQNYTTQNLIRAKILFLFAGPAYLIPKIL